MRYRIDLKREREKRNMTQAQLAELIGVTEKSVSKWESGRGQPSYENMLKICEVFNIDINKIDSDAICKIKTERILRFILIFIGFVIVTFTLIQAIKIRNYNILTRNSSVVEHSYFYWNYYKTVIKRTYFSLSVSISVLIINMFLTIISKKRITVLSFVFILDILFCMKVFKNIDSVDSAIYIFYILCIVCILLIVCANYMFRNRIKEKQYD